MNAFGDGFWDLTAFTLQMAMVVLTGYVVATCPPVAKLIDRLATMPQTARSAVSFVAFLSMSVSFLNWGLSLVFGGLLARAIARRTDLRVDYRALGAAAFLELGAVWALGMSSSAAQLQATASSLPPALLKITGVLDFGKTIFTWRSLLMCAIIIALTVVIAHFSALRGAATPGQQRRFSKRRIASHRSAVTIADENITALENRMVDYLTRLHVPQLGEPLTVK